MMSTAFTVTGADDVARRLGKLERDVGDLSTPLGRVGSRVVVDARVIAPKRSGRLASTIAESRTKNRARLSAGGAAAPYGGPIHYGWAARGIAPHPFLILAAERNEDTTRDELETEIRHRIAANQLS